MELGANSYPIVIGRGILGQVNEFFNLNRNVFIITDDGVPNKYSDKVASLCKNPTVKVIKQGEDSKSMRVLEDVLLAMSDFGLERGDCVVAVGGGVVGDLAGFAASVYMRGVDFYNVPTTLLSQVDSSIGGKTAVNLGRVKNSVGAFKQPKAVLVDIDTLSTLPSRHLANGMAEIIKMAATSNKKLFETLEQKSKNDIYDNIEQTVTEALMIKKSVVEEDEHETGLRKILNFGHTLGHAIESEEGLCGLLHGECVALGMLAITEGSVKDRLKSLIRNVGLPTEYHGNLEEAFSYLSHDKKCTGGKVNAILCPKIGSYEIVKMSWEEFRNTVKNAI